MTLKSQDLRHMTAAERQKVLVEAFASSEASSRTTIVTIQSKIRTYESRYNLSTSDLPAALAENRIQETAEICEWMFWSGVQARLGSARS